MFITSPVRFTGLKDSITPIDHKPSTMPHGIKVYAFKDDALQTHTPCAQGFKVQLQDDSFAYVHPYNANKERRVGAHKLAKLLQLEISPKVKILTTPASIQQEKTNSRPTDPLGTAIDWVDGQTFKAFAKDTPPDERHFDSGNLMELYLFYLISQDSDFHDRNIMVQQPKKQHQPVKLFAIDNEKTASHTESFIGAMWKYPASLRESIEGKRIPADLQAKLQRFLDNQAVDSAKLKRYFTPNEIETFYDMAQFLLSAQTIPTQAEITRHLRKFRKEQSRHSLFQFSQRVLERFFRTRPPSMSPTSTNSQSNPSTSASNSIEL